jgi:FAD/FMN-containing dehydrogenase
VVQAASTADIQRTIAFARANGLPFAVRSGGHSYAGYSATEGVMIDLGRFAKVGFDAASRVSTVGGGARTIDVAAALAPSGVVVPTGTCASVGMSGLALGGGQGLTGRTFGLTCDSLRSVTIVTADGRIRTCDREREPDLFWASRGGGGGNFGVVTRMEFDTHPLSDLTLFTLSWPWAAAADVMAAWQTWAPAAADELWSDCHLLSRDPQGLTVSVNGAFTGSPGSLPALLDGLRSAVGGSAPSTSIRTLAYLDSVLQEAGCIGWSVDGCRLPSQGSQGRLPREDSYAKSDFFSEPLAPAALSALVASVERRATDDVLAGSTGGVVFDVWGGAITRPAPSATAFVHRSGLFIGQYVASLAAGASAQAIARNRTWLRETYAAIHPSANGFAYQNYIDPELRGWEHAYYGPNLPRLRQVKAAVDPQDFFHFAQSIPPAS